MYTPRSFLASASSVVAEFNAWAVRTNSGAHADHICYRCKSKKEFGRIRAMFEHESKYIHQAIISERRIAIIVFLTPIETELGPISVLELSDQKPDGSQIAGFDHIEIYPDDESAAELSEYLLQAGEKFTQTVRPHHTTYDLVLPSGFKVRIEPEPLLEKIRNEEMSI